MNKKTILINKKPVEIVKLPIGRYAELLKRIQELPKKLKDFQALDGAKLIEILPELISDCLPDFIGILEVATPLEKIEIEKLGLDEVIDLSVAVFEVNNYSKVFETLKKALARQKPPEPTS